MEVWLVSLSLCITDDCYNYETFFKYQKVDGVFRDNESEYIQTDRCVWSRKFIPKEYTIKKPSGQYMVVKGFEYEPNDIELKMIKMEMKRILNAHIGEERDRYLNDVEQKLKCLLNE